MHFPCTTLAKHTGGAVAVGLLLVGCGGTTSTSTAAEGGPHLRHRLPPGFTAPGKRVSPTRPVALQTAPVTKLSPSELRAAPLPIDQLQSETLSIVNQPVPTQVRRLLVSREQLRPGETLTMVAGKLPLAPAHAALFVVQGPDYRAQRLVQVRLGIAAALVTLPGHMAPGTWALAAEDLSRLHLAPGGHVTGLVLLNLGIFTVG